MFIAKVSFFLTKERHHAHPAIEIGLAVAHPTQGPTNDLTPEGTKVQTGTEEIPNKF
jgi:hypothetical protein